MIRKHILKRTEEEQGTKIAYQIKLLSVIIFLLTMAINYTWSIYHFESLWILPRVEALLYGFAHIPRKRQHVKLSRLA